MDAESKGWMSSLMNRLRLFLLRHRRYLLGRTLRIFLADPEQCSNPSNAVLGELKYAFRMKLPTDIP